MLSRVLCACRPKMLRALVCARILTIDQVGVNITPTDKKSCVHATVFEHVFLTLLFSLRSACSVREIREEIS